nr:zinc-binding protein A33-like [Nerophis lumbriciformis]
MDKRLENHLQCPTCLDVFKDPVMLPCSHNFCRACLKQWKDTGKRSCLLCRADFGSTVPLPNLALKNLCENLPRAPVKLEDKCSLHEEEFKLFCFDHWELTCMVCRDAGIHDGHKFRPLEEVREELEKSLQNAKERLQDYDRCRENCKEQLEYIKVQKENVERKIKKDFAELRRFLDEEEEVRLVLVRKEGKKKSQRMKKMMAALGEQMEALSDAIGSTEEQLASANLSFKTEMRGIQELPDEPKLIGGALLDEAKHVGNLKYKVWERMKDTLTYSPVILDPNTADPELSLSEDLSSLSSKDVRQRRPKNPDRSWLDSVLGCALDSEKHVWDVEVEDNYNWIVGVTWGDPSLLEVMISRWCIGFWDGQYKITYGQHGEWYPPVIVRRIRVEVDMKKRSLSFSEALTDIKLWSTKNPSDWPDLSAETKMYPYFWTKHRSPLKIVPIYPYVTTDIN